jgi:hypothetical protein
MPSRFHPIAKITDPGSRIGGNRPGLIKIAANHSDDRSETTLIQGIRAPRRSNCASRRVMNGSRTMNDQFGLLRELFLGILSTSSGSALSISRRAIRSINVAVVRPRRSASIAAVSTFRARSSRLLRNAISVPYQRCEMKNPTIIAELHKKLGAPSSDAVESLRLLKAFLRLTPRERFEVIELVERLAAEASSPPDHPLS